MFAAACGSGLLWPDFLVCSLESLEAAAPAEALKTRKATSFERLDGRSVHVWKYVGQCQISQIEAEQSF